MICYRDRTFCRDKKCSRYDECPSAYTPEHEADALKWWGKEGAPVAFYGERRECFYTAATPCPPPAPLGYTNPKARHTYELIQQCRTERANGSSLKQICKDHNLSINTLRGWLYTSRRSYPDNITEIQK